MRSEVDNMKSHGLRIIGKEFRKMQRSYFVDIQKVIPIHLECIDLRQRSTSGYHVASLVKIQNLNVRSLPTLRETLHAWNAQVTQQNFSQSQKLESRRLVHMPGL